jgi:uncharacterized coiled-coil protein SlyX
MPASTEGSNRYGRLSRGISASDVSQAADALLRMGMRPTIEKIRLKIGKGSPNTINPLLDAWWKTLSARLDSGPAALHRLPEAVAHVAEALWMQALEEGRRRAHAELKSSERLAETKDHALEVRSHVLTLREGELDERLRDRERTIDDLNQRLRELTLLLRKEQTTREYLSRQIADLQTARLKKPMRRQHPRSVARIRNAKVRKRSTQKRPKPRTRR